jgi:hypothetical protein
MRTGSQVLLVLGASLLLTGGAAAFAGASIAAHFAQNPDTLAKFDGNPNSATPLRLPADEAEVFLR